MLVIDGVVYNVEEFVGHHPGGERYLLEHIAKDVTLFHGGGIHAHLNAAENLL